METASFRWAGTGGLWLAYTDVYSDPVHCSAHLSVHPVCDCWRAAACMAAACSSHWLQLHQVMTPFQSGAAPALAQLTIITWLSGVGIVTLHEQQPAWPARAWDALQVSAAGHFRGCICLQCGSRDCTACCSLHNLPR